ncbi:potassium transporter KtrB [candidate division KSB1 bacterium]|nr:potassium transporter KtrB [candidate division KSB1 bacterium]RQW10005.1 MAG: potassium transporter KtrB [candidate division KSB1 bacterium]
MQFISLREFIKKMHPVKVALLGYLSYVLIGWIVLSLPFAQSKETAILDNLFTATSAISTTGLTTVSTSDNYSFLGELIVLILIQLGGIGYMTFGSFVILSRKRALSPLRAKVSDTVFTLPKNFRIDKFIKSVVTFTFTIELFGALFLFFIFRAANAPAPLWSAIFHSVSAFCTAGFSIYNNSFESFQNNFWLNLVISILSYSGAIGFIVFVDVWRELKGKIKNITLTSKIILHTTFWLSIGGTIMIFLTESSIQHLAPDARLIASFFQAMTSLTTVGFNTIPIAGIAKGTMLLITVLMVIGASPSGTGGGLKSTTFSAMFGIMKSVLKGESRVAFWRNEIPFERIWTAMASLCFYITFLILGIYLLNLTESFDFERIVFEAASALGTVGLSMGITAELTNLGKIIVTLLMFIGRLGPLSFGMALFLKQDIFYQDDEKDVAI